VDNWNEERIAAENNKVLFQEVSEELVQNIAKIDRVIDLYLRKDSLYYKVLNKKVEFKDYKDTPPDLFQFLFWWLVCELVDDNYNELLTRKSNLTPLQDSIFSDLKDLYGDRKTNTDTDDQFIREIHQEVSRKMMNEQPWFSSYLTNKIVTDEMIEYALTDPFYLNYLSQLKEIELMHLTGILTYRVKALNLYNGITEMLEEEKDSSLVKNIEDFEHVKGTYSIVHPNNENYKVFISGDEKLKLKVIRNDSINISETDIQLYSDSHFITNVEALRFAQIQRIVSGKNKEVLGFYTIYGFDETDGKRAMAEKIE
jgi:hypothetical protein